MAIAAGRPILEVAAESFALTLYTFWHLEQQRWVESQERRAERFDMAGLMAHAFHKPNELRDLREGFLAAIRPASAARPHEQLIALIRSHHAVGAPVPLPLQ